MNSGTESYSRTHDITVEEVKKLESFKHWDSEKATELVRIIKTFTQIAYNIYKKQENNKIISLDIDNQRNIAV
jgi:hypothetical protein